jgi:hypothetical protein
LKNGETPTPDGRTRTSAGRPPPPTRQTEELSQPDSHSEWTDNCKRHIQRKCPRLVEHLTRLHVDDSEVAWRIPVAARDERECFSIRAVREAENVLHANVLHAIGGGRYIDRLADLLVRLGIEEPNPCAPEPGHRERLPVRADGNSLQVLVLSAVHDPDHGRAALERVEQVAAGLGRVVDRDRLASEQERKVEVILDERLGAQALRELSGLGFASLRRGDRGPVGGVACMAALEEGEDAAGDRCRESDCDDGERDPQAPVLAVALL